MLSFQTKLFLLHFLVLNVGKLYFYFTPTQKCCPHNSLVLPVEAVPLGPVHIRILLTHPVQLPPPSGKTVLGVCVLGLGCPSKLVSIRNNRNSNRNQFRFYTETKICGVSIEPKQTEEQLKQCDREHILVFFHKIQDCFGLFCWF